MTDHKSTGLVFIVAVACIIQVALCNTAQTQSHSTVSARFKRQVHRSIASESGSAHRQSGRRPRINERRVVTSLGCSCDDVGLSQAVSNIADLTRRMNEQEALSKENKDMMQTLVRSNQQLQSQVARVVSENQRLTRLVRSQRGESIPVPYTANKEPQRDIAPREGDINQRAGPKPAPRRSPVHQLHDVIGNREAEMAEMGIFPPVQSPSAARPVGFGRTPFSSSPGQSSRRPDSDQMATSLLMLNRENGNLARKIDQLQARMDQTIREHPASQSRQNPAITSQFESKIAQLERLVLVALQTPAEGRQTETGRDFSKLSTSRGVPDSVSTVSQMNDDDLDALVNVVDSVQNRKPRKSAFSVASTGITLGVNEEPRAIEFDHEFVNKGGDFKRRLSRFVCEIPGFYYITFTLRSYDGKYLGVALMKNEDLQTAVYADSNERNIMQTQSLIVHLEDGDEVWLRHAPSDTFAVHSGIHRYITFSGFLIYKGY